MSFNAGHNFSRLFVFVLNLSNSIVLMNNLLFGDDFIFSASTSSYQIEGAWNVDGKGQSIWDNLTHSKPYLTINRANGDVACDSYHLYREDVKLLKSVGVFDFPGQEHFFRHRLIRRAGLKEEKQFLQKPLDQWTVFNGAGKSQWKGVLEERGATPLVVMYRFSISWTRVLPRGDLSEINEVGVQYYHNLIDDLLLANIQPMVTIYHWDLPQRFEDEGGWLNVSIVDRLETYANFLFGEYGNKVKWWVTINEPDSIVKGYTTDTKAPALNLGEFSPAAFRVVHHTLLSHGRIFRLYNRVYRATQNGKISLALSGQYHLAMTNSIRDVKAAEHTMTLSFDWYAHPIYSRHGGYPENLRKYVKYKCQLERNCTNSILPEFTSDEKRMIRGSYDFFGLNHYTSFFSFHIRSNASFISRSDYDVIREQNPRWPKSSLTWLRIFPQGFFLMLRWIKYRYNNPAIFVTENGYCDHGQINDTTRVCYHQFYLEQMMSAMHRYKINVIGYSIWSFIDNFEWTYGYKPRFGIVHVDFENVNRTRTPKQSFEFFKQLIQNRSVPQMLDCERIVQSPKI